MNSKKLGDIGLARAIAYYTNLGYTVSLPLTDSQPYDLIVDGLKDLEKVQVKYCTTTDKYGNPFVSLAVRGGSKGTIQKVFEPVDRLFVATPNAIYDIPCNEFNCSVNITLSKKYNDFKASVV